MSRIVFKVRSMHGLLLLSTVTFVVYRARSCVCCVPKMREKSLPSEAPYCGERLPLRDGDTYVLDCIRGLVIDKIYGVRE